MDNFYILFITILFFSCSANVENDKVPKKNSLAMEKKSVISINAKSKPVIDKHISGNDTQSISGVSSSHISGK